MERITQLDFLQHNHHRPPTPLRSKTLLLHCVLLVSCPRVKTVHPPYFHSPLSVSPTPEIVSVTPRSV
ncbi:hypothetical protein GE061_010524 [Apolygus lucorum]|uniref:Uncharacterized protein n=1 Tax=Apolygus lucorum TaxID=248454 RepID=A0A8S9XYW5_APOLU|nr:hypothetical protein GE061_010524 [Apolygus lucorum]